MLDRQSLRIRIYPPAGAVLRESPVLADVDRNAERIGQGRERIGEVDHGIRGRLVVRLVLPGPAQAAKR